MFVLLVGKLMLKSWQEPLPGNGLLVVGVLTCLCDCLCLCLCLCLCASENQPLIICFTFDYVTCSKITTNHRLRKFSQTSGTLVFFFFFSRGVPFIKARLGEMCSIMMASKWPLSLRTIFKRSAQCNEPLIDQLKMNNKKKTRMNSYELR